MPKSFKRGAANRRPADGTVRHSQIVGTFGPGAMVDLVHTSALIGGLDFWHAGKGLHLKPIQDERLAKTVAEMLKASGRHLSSHAPFFQPPMCPDQEPTPDAGIQALEFPNWLVCQGPKCRALVRKGSTHVYLKNERYRHLCDRGTDHLAVPVRFVAACPHGHLQDFYWRRFVHMERSEDECQAASLRLEEGVIGDFSQIWVTCVSCGARRPLVQAMVTETNLKCLGKRPWLGEGNDADEKDCTQRLRLLVRSASNAYFPQVVSALSIDEGESAHPLAEVVDGVWHLVRLAEFVEDLPTLRRTQPSVGAAFQGHQDAELMSAILARRASEDAPLRPIREVEYEHLTQQERRQPRQSDRFVAETTRLATMPPGLGQVVAVRKLREVRVQVGFTRLEPATPDLQGEYNLKVRSAPLGLLTDWLPANEVRGEGLFFRLDGARLRAWEARPAVVERAQLLQAGHLAWCKTVSSKRGQPFPGARYYLLHSLSHLVLSAISLECGYAASAMRERIYCSMPTETPSMAGVLLSTGTPGSEGTLGGLVEQASNILTHLRRAWDLGVFCANDPVCAHHNPGEETDDRHLEGAACHGCLFVAECSCDRFNQFLDRALVVPTLGQDPKLAYFESRP